MIHYATIALTAAAVGFGSAWKYQEKDYTAQIEAMKQDWQAQVDAANAQVAEEVHKRQVLGARLADANLKYAQKLADGKRLNEAKINEQEKAVKPTCAFNPDWVREYNNAFTPDQVSP